MNSEEREVLEFLDGQTEGSKLTPTQIEEKTRLAVAEIITALEQLHQRGDVTFASPDAWNTRVRLPRMPHEKDWPAAITQQGRDTLHALNEADKLKEAEDEDRAAEILRTENEERKFNLYRWIGTVFAGINATAAVVIAFATVAGLLLAFEVVSSCRQEDTPPSVPVPAEASGAATTAPTAARSARGG